MAHFADTNLVYLEFASIADAAIRTAIFFNDRLRRAPIKYAILLKKILKF